MKTCPKCGGRSLRAMEIPDSWGGGIGWWCAGTRCGFVVRDEDLNDYYPVEVLYDANLD